MAINRLYFCYIISLSPVARGCLFTIPFRIFLDFALDPESRAREN